MKWGAALGVTVLVAIIFRCEWPQMNPNQKKEKAAFFCLMSMGWLLGIILVAFPDLPSSSDLLDTLFKPLEKMLEK